MMGYWLLQWGCILLALHVGPRMYDRMERDWEQIDKQILYILLEIVLYLVHCT